ncbi:MAG TPA: hypothetical protein V6C85_01730 [Allocoleopsis sp.]
MLQTQQMLEKDSATQDKNLLSILNFEVDEIFFNLRKADQVIRYEISLLNQGKNHLLKRTTVPSINEERLRTIIDSIPAHHLLTDEYIKYMLENEHSSIFRVLREYNLHLEKRRLELEQVHPNGEDYAGLLDVDEKLVHYIRHLGAMTYHLNIHVNLLTVLLRSTYAITEPQQVAIRASKEIVTEYMVNEWGEHQKDVRFLEITIDGLYALVTWSLEDLKGDAILIQNEGYWQLMSISADVFDIEDFENVNVPSEIAQRILKLHHKKLGY